MGRNVKEVKVGVNGAIYRNSAGNGLIIDSDGAQYLPSTATCLLSNTNYAKYVSLNTQTSGVQNQAINSSSAKNFGTVVPSTTSLNLSQYIPYFGTVPATYYPFTSRTGKYRYLGMGATNGTNSLGQQNAPGYKQGQSNAQSVAVYNATTGAYVGSPSIYPLACWYDSSTSLFRVIASPSSVGSTSPALLYTSSTGATWTATTPTMVSQVSAFDYRAFGGNTYYNVGISAVNQKAFFGLGDTNGSNQYTFFRTTNGGATITEVTTAITTAAAYYTPAQTGMCRFNHNYDGTTVFVPANSRWCYSTDDGTTFTTTTISGVVTSSDQSPVGAFSAGNYSSTFMMIYNSRVTSNRVYVTTNGGQSFTTYSWTPAATLNSSYYQCPGDYDSANTRWCFVYGTTAGWYAAVSTNNGATWTHNLIQSAPTDDPQMNIVFLGNVWYVFGSIGIWKSTDAATWTNISTTNTNVSYVQPYMELADYVMFGSVVVKKSDFSTTVFNPPEIISNAAGYAKNLQIYLGADAIMQVQGQYTTFPLLVTSATAGTANNYSPYPYSSQQSGANQPIDIEYWRIK